MSRRVMPGQVPTWTAGWVLALPLAWGAAQADPLACRPDVKYECSRAHCTRQTEGFAHAESYRYDPAQGMLTACLWSGCFEGRVRRTEGAGAFLVSGDLSGPAGQHFLVSLTVAGDGRFSADWHDPANPVLELGQCRAEGKQP